MHTPRADTLSVGHLTRLVYMKASKRNLEHVLPSSCRFLASFDEVSLHEGKQKEPGTCFAIKL